MSHLDEDLIAGIALGDDADEAHRLHVEQCQVCAARLAEMEEIVGDVRSVGRVPDLLTPPDHVWKAIQDEISADDAAAEVDEFTAARLRKRPVTTWKLLAAAAAGIVIGGVGVAGIVNGLPGPTEEPPLVAQGEIKNFATDEVSGSAAVHTLPDGSGLLVLDVPVEPVDGAALEVWLIASDLSGMISLGHLTPDTTSFVIPAGFDVGEFPVVDVSVEPFDGDPTHSGESIHRGTLDV